MTTPEEPFDRDHPTHTNLSAKITHAIRNKDKNNEEHAIENWSNFRHKDLGALVSTYPHDLLKKIDEFLAPTTEENHSSFRGNAIKLYVLEESTAGRINEALYFLPLFDPAKGTPARATIASLHEYPQLPPSDDYSREAPTIIAQCTALIHITGSLLYLCRLDKAGLDRETLFTHDWTIADEQLVDLALTYPEHGEQISDLIIQREHVNIDLIKDTLTNESPVLNHGLL
jgi:hypothetical protein